MVEEDVTAALPQHDRGRKDYNFPNAWLKLYARYQPNKQVNLDTIIKWEALTDEDLSFADFHGKCMKLINEMELIGQPPTEGKRYEMLRKHVKNPYLNEIVAKLSLPDTRRISLDDFFEDCNYFIQYTREKGSGRKRKAEEVLGRVVILPLTYLLILFAIAAADLVISSSIPLVFFPAHYTRQRCYHI